VSAQPGPERLGNHTERRQRRNTRTTGKDVEAVLPGSRRGLSQQTALADTALANQDRAAGLTRPGGLQHAAQMVELQLASNHDRR
jgi:hypothetical protein